jgi:hypothetical protein
MFESLAKGTDPDRMKGALYTLGNKGNGRRCLSLMLTLSDGLIIIQPPMRFPMMFLVVVISQHCSIVNTKKRSVYLHPIFILFTQSP